MKAAEIKHALRRRHPTATSKGAHPWTVIEEWHEIDLLAFSCWRNGGIYGARYPRVGYEVKVSRSDYRRELLRPFKRAGAVAFCNAFYLAVPDGLLSSDELAYEEPDWSEQDWMRERCPAGCYRDRRLRKNGRYVGDAWEWQTCRVCRGRGYLGESRVEREAPTCWVPADIGLVVVTDTGRSRIVRKSPIRAEVSPVADQVLASLVRWVSLAPPGLLAPMPTGTT